MIGHRPGFLSKPFLDSQHFLSGGCGVAVDAGYKIAENLCLLLICLLGFTAVHGVLDHILQTTRFSSGCTLWHIRWILRFIRILHIDDQLAKPAVYPPDRCNCHYCFLGCGFTTASVMVLTAASNCWQAASYRWTSMTFRVCAF